MNEQEEYEANKEEVRQSIENPDKDNITEDVKLDSEKTIEEEVSTEEKLYANNFKSVEELKKGITNLNSTLPEYILNGMNDEALEQHYEELRKEFSSKKVEDEKADNEDKKEEKPDDSISDELWTDLESSFNENGGITEEQYAELNKLGIPDNIIDGYIDGIKAKIQVGDIEQQKFTDSVYALADGKENYEEIKAWAEDNYSQKEIDMIASGSYDEILMKFEAVKNRYDRENGKVDRVKGNMHKGIAGYNNQQEYITDRMSMEYKKNPSYKLKVDTKFKASSFGS